MNYKLTALIAVVSALTISGCATRGEKDTGKVTVESVNTPSAATTTTAATSEAYSDANRQAISAAQSALQNRVVHFDYDSSEISNIDYQTLQAHAKYLIGNSQSRVALIGHADERGTREYNMALGERRAKSVAAFLVSNGVNSSQLETVSYGKEQPVNLGHNESAWRENRRVEINYEAAAPK